MRDINIHISNHILPPARVFVNYNYLFSIDRAFFTYKLCEICTTPSQSHFCQIKTLPSNQIHHFYQKPPIVFKIHSISKLFKVSQEGQTSPCLVWRWFIRANEKKSYFILDEGVFIMYNVICKNIIISKGILLWQIRILSLI